jgi:hypothetical protein
MEFRELALFFCSMERNSTLFSLPGNGSEQNSKCLLLFLVHGMEFGIVFSSVEWFGTKFREFSVPRNSRNSTGTNQLFHLLHLPQSKFLSKIADPSYTVHLLLCPSNFFRHVNKNTLFLVME